MNRRTAQPPVEFVSRCYSTIAIALCVVELFWLIYVYRFTSYYEADSGFEPAAWTIGGVLGVAIVISALLSGDQEKIRFVWGHLPALRRARLLPIVTIVSLSAIATMCAITGGAHSSPFASFLFASSTLAIVFAWFDRNKLLVTALTVIAYWTVSYLWRATPDGVPPMILFKNLTATLAIALAVLASWNIKHGVDRSVSSSQTPHPHPES